MTLTDEMIRNLIIYAGTPDNVDKEVSKDEWGTLNKQLAFSNLTKFDIWAMEETVTISRLRKQAVLRDHELKSVNQDEDQKFFVTKCLLSLGSGGFLLKRATTQSHRIEQIGDKDKGLLSFGKPKPDNGGIN